MSESNQHEFLQWIADNRIGDIASISGTLLTVFGFLITIYGVWASKSASERAEKAADDAKKSIMMFDIIHDYSSAIAIIDEIKRLHRVKAWTILPDRYTTLKKYLINIRTAHSTLTDNHKDAIQDVVLFISSLESQVEKAAEDEYQKLDTARMNTIMNKRVDKLYELLNELKSSNT